MNKSLIFNSLYGRCLRQVHNHCSRAQPDIKNTFNSECQKLKSMSHEAIWTQFLLQMQVASDIISSNFADTQSNSNAIMSYITSWFAKRCCLSKRLVIETASIQTKCWLYNSASQPKGFLFVNCVLPSQQQAKLASQCSSCWTISVEIRQRKVWVHF